MIETQQSSGTMAGIDETIGRMEQFYRVITGQDAPPAEAVYAPIPAEKDPTEHVEKQLKRLLGMLGQVSTPEAAHPWTPPMSVYESDSEILLCVDLPGVRRENVEVVAQGNLLTISGLRPTTANNGFRLSLNECRLGPFRRAVMIPQGVAEPSAQMKEGVLEVRIPKAESNRTATPRPVPVN